MQVSIPTENIPTAHRECVQSMIEMMVNVGMLIAATRQMVVDAEAAGHELPQLSPSPGFLDIASRDSGLAKIIRAAVKVDYLRGDEPFLSPVSWR